MTLAFPALLAAGDDPLFVRRGSVAVVYLHLLKRLDTTEWRIVKGGTIARRLHMRPNTVGEALRLLQEAGYLEASPYDGRTRMFRLVFDRNSAPNR